MASWGGEREGTEGMRGPWRRPLRPPGLKNPEHGFLAPRSPPSLPGRPCPSAAAGPERRRRWWWLWLAAARRRRPWVGGGEEARMAWPGGGCCCSASGASASACSSPTGLFRCSLREILTSPVHPVDTCASFRTLLGTNDGCGKDPWVSGQLQHSAVWGRGNVGCLDLDRTIYLNL